MIGEDQRVRMGDGNYSSKYPKQSDFVSAGVPFISNKNIKEGRILPRELRFISKKQHQELKKGHLKYGDVLISTRANIGDIAWVDQEFDGANINAQLVFLRADNIHLYSRFLFYLLISPQYKKIFESFSSGSAQAQLPIHALKKISISFPPFVKQKEIAAVLSSLDDKIELLRKQNETLEQIARAIFHEWFVEFNFPNEKGQPYKISDGKMIESEFGEIPEGWKIGTVNDVITRYSITYRCDTKDLDVKGKTPIFDQGSSGLYGYTNREPDFEASTENPVVLFANHTCNMWLVNYPFCAIQNVIPFRGNKQYDTFFVFYMTLGQISFKEYKGHWPDFEQKEYVIPAPDVAQSFSEIVRPLQHKIWNNTTQTQHLSTLRDALLPKLMSGEIRVQI